MVNLNLQCKKTPPPKIPSTVILCVQQVVGILLYYDLAVGCTLLLSLSNLAPAQLNKCNKVWYDLVWLLNNASTRSDTSITYIASYMCFHAHIDASYLSTPNARSRASGNVFFGDKPTQRTLPADAALNRPIHVVCKIIKNVMGSAAEYEIGTCYINARELLPIRVCA